jgi:alginate O-acetyltransferase complex protein AlgI
MVFSSPVFLFIVLPFLTLFNAFVLFFNYKKISEKIGLNLIKIQNFSLFIVNIIFYAWSGIKSLNFILPLILITYIGGIFVEKVRYKRIALFLFILFNTSVLFFFKYWKIEGIIAPIGISFIFFKLVSYLSDIFNNKIKSASSFYDFLQYVMFFPQVLSGPIQRYDTFISDFYDRKCNYDTFTIALKQFIFGLSKKVIIADTLAVVVDKIFKLTPFDFNFIIAWIGAIFYALQIYYDFSGYSDMSIGVAKMLGFKNVPDNFNYPYISKSITEFWRRWHITLGSWFRDYIYIPLGGNRVSKLRMYVNLWIVFLLTGIWHGNTYIFIIWGAWHGFFNCFEKITGWNNQKSKTISVIQHFYCFLVIVIGWVLFRSPNLQYATHYFLNMFGLLGGILEQYKMWYYIDRFEIVVFFVAIVSIFPFFKNFKEKNNLFINVYIIFLLLASLSFIASNTYQSFLYFQF